MPTTRNKKIERQIVEKIIRKLM